MKRQRTRSRLFSPSFVGPVEGWVRNYIRRNAWRVPIDYGPDDLYQDAYAVFLRIADHYPDVRSPRHFMALFMRAYANHITNLSNARTTRASWESMLIDPLEIEEQTNALIECPDHLGERLLRRQIKTGPRAIKRLLGIMHIDRLTFERAATPPRVKRCRRRRETTNEYFCRLVGFDPEMIDFAGMIRSWVTGERKCTLQR